MQPQDRVSPRGLFMHVLPRIPHGRSSGSVKLHSWVTTLGQQGTEPDLRIYAVVHRCERIRAVLRTRPQGSLRSRQFQPVGSVLGQQGTELFRGCRGNERGRKYNPQLCEKRNEHNLSCAALRLELRLAA